jgi:diguanylate cyclase (GGDEF)-like protein/putative nucleotidyltransferase with HDIG domain/PAS domain S-box-containing protein
MDRLRALDILRSGFIDEIPLIIVGLDEKGRVHFWNKQAEEVTGFVVEDAITLGLQTILPVLTPENNLNPAIDDALSFLKSVFSGKESIEGKETAILSKDGQVRYVKWSGYIAEDGEEGKGKILILSGLDQTDLYALRDVLTEKSRYVREAARRLKKYTKIDPLTGLFNYRHLISELNKNFYSAIENDGTLALAIINVDYFYSVNSAYGTSNGDRVLRELGSLVKNTVDESFIVSRFSGGEIAILMPETDIKTAFKWSRKVFSSVSEHDFAFRGESTKVNLSVRMALGGYPHCEDAKTPEQLIGRILDKLTEGRDTASSSVLICSPNASLTSDILPDNLMKGEYPYTVEFVNALARAVKSKDNYTQEHSSIMSEYAVSIADNMGLNGQAIRDIRLGSILHDVGKIGVDKCILLKPDVLTVEEREIIKQHPRIGAEIIRHVHPLKGVVPIVLYHHERYDGEGYLDGLKGDEIPMGARIVSLADVFQALTSNRPYRKALPQNQALSIIREYSGSFFDPKVVDSFFEVYASRR